MSTDLVADAEREMLSLLTARVRDAHVAQPLVVDGGLDIVAVCRALAAQGSTTALVRDGDRLGIFTTTDLRDALLRTDGAPATLAVRDAAHFELVEINADADLFEAMWLMLRHRVHRLLVRDAGGGVAGVLAQLDLVGLVANHSSVIAQQIDGAASVDELGAAARRIDAMVELLHDSGLRIERVARLVGALNRHLFARLWTLVAPAELVANACLIVMGSEGRGEQILKTDQDNALLLRAGVALPGLDAVAQRFNAALAAIGYPPCPGDIMLTNPVWRQDLPAFRETLRGWVYGGQEEGVMQLAIFFDAAAVAGDASLLAEARRYLADILADNDAFLARFARAADQFAAPASTWWSRLMPRSDGGDSALVDLKKLGVFPIVHGVRALALQFRVADLGTAQRLRALVAGRHLDAELARDVNDALHHLMALRLAEQLRQRQRGEAATNLVRPAALATLEREALGASLAIVGRFRQHLQRHFRLDSL